MSIGKSRGLRTWILGTAATGALWNSVPNIGSAADAADLAQKKAASKSVIHRSSAKSQILPNAKNAGSNDHDIQLVSQAVASQDGKSEVQRQLEELYKQDGREMPQMNLNLQPMTPGVVPGGVPTQPQANPINQTTPSSPVQSVPRTSPSNTNLNRSALGYTQYQPKPSAAPTPPQAAIGQSTSPPVKSRPTTMIGYLKKLTGGNKQSTAQTSQPPVPPDFNTGVPNATSSLAGNPSNFAPPRQQQAPIQYPEPVRLNAQAARPLSQPSQPVTRPVTTASTMKTNLGFVQSAAAVSSTTVQTAQSVSQLPPLSQQPTPISVEVAQSSASPVSNEAPSESGVASIDSKQEAMITNPTALALEFPNPFPELTEAEADSKAGATLKKAEPLMSKPAIAIVPKEPVVIAPDVPTQNPVKVEAGLEENNEPGIARVTDPVPVQENKTSDDPFAVDAKGFLEMSPMDADINDPTAPKLEAPAIAPLPLTEPKNLLPELTTVPVQSHPISESTTNNELEFVPPIQTSRLSEEKMRKIHERFGMKGLKGFCPVTLRDERELCDSKPEFHFTHRRQKFHFASAEAREKFAANPLRYRPAAYGADVVALGRDKQVVEGTLDHAAWYLGRLFLFGSKENHDTFVNDPSQFATIEGIE